LLWIKEEPPAQKLDQCTLHRLTNSKSPKTEQLVIKTKLNQHAT